LDAPDLLDIPIVKRERVSDAKDFIPAPRSYIRPSVDGLVTSYLEWSAASLYVPNPEFGSMHRAGRLILSSFHYGFSTDILYFRFDLDPVATECIKELHFEMLFPRKDRKVYGEISFVDGTSRWRFNEIGHTHDASVEVPEGSGEPMTAAYNKVIEVGLPMDLLDCRKDERLDFFITIQPKGTLGERWPLYGTFSAELPGVDFEERNWAV